MSDRENFKVYCFLRIIECVASSVCFSFHVFKIMAMKDELFPYEIVLRFAYLGFMILSAFSAIGHIKEFLNFYYEAACGISGFIYFMFASIWSMAVVEHDEHLEYLTEAEEFQHLFFQINRFQSVLALLSAMLFLLHATFAIDHIQGARNREIDDVPSAPQLPRFSLSSMDEVARKPLKLFFFPEMFWERAFQKK